MSERLKLHRKTRLLYNEKGNQIGEEEEVYEPTEQVVSPEFSGVVGTLSLAHGSVPPKDESGGYWDIYKVYEKVVIWLHHGKREVV